MSCFWNLIIEPGKKYEKIVDNGIHVTRATLDTSKAKPDDGLVRVCLKYDNCTMVVANLGMKQNVFQTELDLTFQPGDQINFTSSGAKVPVTLTGLALADEEDEEYSNSEMGEEEESHLDTEVLNGGRGKRLREDDNGKPAKAAKSADGKRITMQDQTFDSADESEDESYNPVPDLTNGEDLDLLEGDETVEMEDDTDEDVEDESGDENMDDDEDLDDEYETEEDMDEILSDEDTHEESPVKEPPKKKKHLEVAKSPKPAPVSQSGTPKPSKGDKNKDKTPNKEAKQSKKEHKSEAAVGKENVTDKTHTPKEKKKKNKDKSDKTPMSKTNGDAPPASTPKQMRAGGVAVEDIKVGTGAEAKSGQMVSMYYEGTLKNGKVFDKNVSGAPFKFRLGRGEVIRGWDVGVVGMKIGGKRKLAIPPNMAYGKQGSPPVIPPNAFLNFTVTLTAIH